MSTPRKRRTEQPKEERPERPLSAPQPAKGETPSRRRHGACRRVCVAVAWAAAVALVYLVSWPLVMLLVIHPPKITETVQLRSFEVPVSGLHPSLHGLKIAQLSDIHFNDNNSVEMGTSDDILEQAWRIVEREEVDLVVLTGDYVDHWPEAAGVLGAKWLGRLKSRHGAVAILGNHDYQKPQSQRLVLDAFARANITVLINSRTEPINEWLEVVGVGDLWEDYHPHRVMYPLPSPSEAAPVDDDGGGESEQHRFRKARVVLTHNPDSALDLNRWGADLMLAGHTHGGKSCLPPGLRELWPLVSYLPFDVRRRIPGSLALNNWELSYGWIDVPRRPGPGESAPPPHEPATIPLYVTSGLDRLPSRFLFCHPEVAVFTLVPRPA